MIIDHLNALLTGGAAIAARRIHNSLVDQGVDSRFWYSARGGQSTDQSTYHPIRWNEESGNPLFQATRAASGVVRRISQKHNLRRHLRGHPPQLELFTTAIRPRATLLDRDAVSGDILHLHWLTKMVDYPTFFASLPDELPIVWTLHDINPMTGGCHYTLGCDAFTTECKHCPQLGRRGANDLSQVTFQAKLEALQGKNLHIVANSHWTLDEARRSRMFAGARSFQTIHYGLDVGQFTPQDRQHCRAQLGLPSDAHVVAFGADAIDNHRKGLRVLLDALAQLQTSRQVVAVFFGKGEIPAIDLPNHIELRSVGFLKTPAEQATLYSAADLFVIASLEEAFGQTGIEAMACGTPVVGFDTGGIPDYVRSGQTGLLAKVGDATDLAHQIDTLANHPAEARRMGKTAREVVLNEFDDRKQARQYVDLYKCLMGETAFTGRDRENFRTRGVGFGVAQIQARRAGE